MLVIFITYYNPLVMDLSADFKNVLRKRYNLNNTIIVGVSILYNTTLRTTNNNSQFCFLRFSTVDR